MEPTVGDVGAPLVIRISAEKEERAIARLAERRAVRCQAVQASSEKAGARRRKPSATWRMSWRIRGKCSRSASTQADDMKGRNRCSAHSL